MLDLRVKELFFDSAAILKAVDDGARKALNRIGAYIRLTAQRSIRRRKGPAPAGQPPHSHNGLLRKHIYYSYDPTTKTVIAGPALLRTSQPYSSPVGGATIPQVTEMGGRVRMKARGRKRSRVVPVAPRPFMRPALEESQRAEKLQEHWRNAFRGR